jgi:hypothetical protein
LPSLAPCSRSSGRGEHRRRGACRERIAARLRRSRQHAVLERAQGFENKLAELIAQKLDVRLEYSWFAEESGYVPNTMGRGLRSRRGYAQGTGLIEDTNPYYYTSMC